MSIYQYWEVHLLRLEFGELPQLVGYYCTNYLLPKQNGGTSQIHVNPTQLSQQMDLPIRN